MKDGKNVQVSSLLLRPKGSKVDGVCLSSFKYTVMIRFGEFERNKWHVRSVMIVTKKMFSDCGGFATVCLFVNWSTLFVKTFF